jgi:hypothetical protein
VEEKEHISLSLTRDNFLEVLLDKNDRWSPQLVRSIMPTSQALEHLYLGVLTYLSEQGYVSEDGGTDTPAAAAGQLPLMIGKTVHVNVSKLFLGKDLKDFTASMAILTSVVVNHYTDNPAALVPLIPTLVGMVKRLKRQLGEVCVVEYIREYYSRRLNSGATAELIAHELRGEPCRYPGQECRYEAAGICAIKVESVTAVIQALKGKEIVEPITHEEPLEWRLRL